NAASQLEATVGMPVVVTKAYALRSHKAFRSPGRRLFIYPLKRSGARDALRRLAVAAYAARSVLRRRLATPFAVIGLALGIAIASAPWVATDSTLRGLADYYVGGVSIDLTASGSERNVVNASVAAGW